MINPSSSEIFDFIARFEGIVPHFYLDTNGHVTVGVGNLVPSADAAKALFMRDRASHAQATPLELYDEYEAIHSMLPGMRASAYMRYCNLEMAGVEIRRLFDRRAAEFQQQLRAVYPNYDACPGPCQLALLDMAFNLGANALNKRWPRLKSAVSAMNWSEAAKQSYRPQSRKERNEAVAEMFHAGLFS